MRPLGQRTGSPDANKRHRADYRALKRALRRTQKRRWRVRVARVDRANPT